MNETREMFREWDNMSKSTRKERLAFGVDMLTKLGVGFTTHNNGTHLVVSHAGKVVDYWPSTGRWIERGADAAPYYDPRKGRTVQLHLRKSEGRGIRNLLALLHVSVPVT